MTIAVDLGGKATKQTNKIIGWPVILCSLHHSDLIHNQEFYGKQARKCIRIRIIIFKVFISVGILLVLL